MASSSSGGGVRDMSQFVKELDQRITVIIHHSRIPSRNDLGVKVKEKIVRDYDVLTKDLKEHSEIVVRRIYAKHVELVQAMARHSKSSLPELSEKAGRLLGGVLFLPQTPENFNNQEADKIMSDVLENILESNDKAIVTRNIWVLNQQKLSDAVLEKKVPEILAALAEVAKKEDLAANPQIQNEIVRCFATLYSRCPRAMIVSLKSWMVSAIKIGGMTKNARIRERVNDLFDSFLAHFIARKTFPDHVAAICDKEHIRPTLKEVCKNLETEMKKEAGADEMGVLRLFESLIRLMGKALHNGTSLLNAALKIVEAGFKSVNPDTRRMSFVGWRALVENFGLETKTLLNRNRLKLLSQPLVAGTCPTEAVALEKLKTWWSLVVALGSEIEENFSALAIPLLRFCVGGKHEVLDLTSQPDKSLSTSFQSPLTPKTPHLYSLAGKGSPAKGPELHKSLTTYDTLQGAIGEILAKILMGKAFKMENGSYENVKCEGIKQPVTVLDHYHVLFQCFRIWSKTEKAKAMEERYDICVGCLEVLLRLLVEAKGADSYSTVLESALLQFREFILENDSFSPSQILGFHEVVGKHLVGRMESLTLTDEKLGEEGPALYLLEPLVFLLLVTNPDCLQSQDIRESFVRVMRWMVESMFLGPPAKLLDSLECLFTSTLGDHVERLPGTLKVEIWAIVAAKFLEFLQANSEINQGDKTAPNFVSAYVTLTFPLAYITELTCPGDCKSFLLNEWKKLYQEIHRCVSLVSTTEPNTLAQEYASFIKKHGDFIVKDPSSLYTSLECSKIILDTLDFGAIAPQEGSYVVSLSPSKYGSKKEKQLSPLRKLHPLAELLGFLMKHLLDGSIPDKAKLEEFSGGCVGAVLGCLMTLFESVTVDSQLAALVELLAQDIAALLKASEEKDSHISFKGWMTKVDLCLTTLCNSLRRYYGGPFDSQFLKDMEPLVIAAMTHSRRSIKNEIITFWGDSFAKASTLNYSPEMKAALVEVKGKSWIMTPGLGESDAPKPASPPGHPVDPAHHLADTELVGTSSVVKGQASPQKIFGSLLKKTDTETEEAFPAELKRLEEEEPVPQGKAKKGIRRKRKSPSNEFVEIVPQAKKPMVLTRHQKEMMEARPEMPFMELTESQDVPPVLPTSIFAQSQDTTTLDTDFRAPAGATEEEKVVEGKRNRAKKTLTREFESAVAEEEVVVGRQSTTDIINSDPKLLVQPTVLVENLSEEAVRKAMGGEDDASIEGTERREKEEMVEEKAGVSPEEGEGNMVEEEDTSLEVIEPTQEKEEESKEGLQKRKRSTPRRIAPKEKKSPTRKTGSSPLSLKRLATIAQSATKTKQRAKRGRPKKVSLPVSEDLVKGEDIKSAVSVSEGKKTEESPLLLTPRTVERAVAPVATSLLLSEPPEKEEEKLEVEEEDVASMDLEEEEEEVPPPSMDPVASMDLKEEEEEVPPPSVDPVASMDLKEEEEVPAPSVDPVEEVPDSLAIPEEKTIISTPGILKKAVPEVNATPERESNGARVRHVHFDPKTVTSVSDDEICRRTEISTSRNLQSRRSLEAGDQPKSMNTPPLSFTRSFTPRTLRMLEAVQQRQTTSEEAEKKQEGSSDLGEIENGGEICPELSQCPLRMEPILPRITSATMIRGLGNLLRARGLETVGHLASLSEAQVHQLPLKTPKVLVLCTALRDAASENKGEGEQEPVDEDQDDSPLRKLEAEMVEADVTMSGEKLLTESSSEETLVEAEDAVLPPSEEDAPGTEALLLCDRIREKLGAGGMGEGDMLAVHQKLFTCLQMLNRAMEKAVAPPRIPSNRAMEKAVAPPRIPSE